MDRYNRNLGTFTEEEMTRLRSSSVAVVGCGGLGGYLIELLARMGISRITAVDGDSFQESNLNRQLYSTEKNTGCNKATEAARRVRLINSDVAVNPVCDFMTAENSVAMLQGHSCVLDALDNIPARLILEDTAQVLGIPLIHGAVNGFLIQAAVVYPGDRTLHKIYGPYTGSGGITPSVPSFTPAFCASIQAAEAVRLLCGRKDGMAGKVMLYDMAFHEITWFEPEEMVNE